MASRIIVSRRPGGGGGGAGVSSIAESGQAALTGAVTLSEGSGITLTQAGQDIEIAAAAVAADFVKLEDKLLGADTASFDFQNISQDYLHLEIVVFLRAAAGGSNRLGIRFNNDSGNNYGATATGTGQTGATNGIKFYEIDNTGNEAGVFGAGKLLIPGYSVAARKKSMFGYGSQADPTTAASNSNFIGSGAWSGTDAITRVTLYLQSGSNFAAGSRATLYGVN